MRREQSPYWYYLWKGKTTIGKMDCTVHSSEGMNKRFFDYHARGQARPFVVLPAQAGMVYLIILGDSKFAWTPASTDAMAFCEIISYWSCAALAERLTNVVISTQEDSDRTRQNLWLSRKDWSDGSVGCAQGVPPVNRSQPLGGF
jgi:hypothetical protein